MNATAGSSCHRTGVRQLGVDGGLWDGTPRRVGATARVYGEAVVIPGASTVPRWRLVGAEAVLKLRALRASGDFDAYWDFHEAREYERNHAQQYADGIVPPVTEPPPPPSSPRLRRAK